MSNIEVQEQRLPLLREPYEDEGFLGYCTRMAELNYVSFGTIAALIGRRDYAERGLAHLAANRGVIRAILGIAERDTERMAVIAAAPEDKHTRIGFGNQQFSQGVIDLLRPKVCLPCLAEAPYRRLLWDLSFYTDCPTHQVEMIDACGSCGAKLGWITSRVATCGCCGRNLKAPLVKSSDQVVEMVARLAQVAPVTPAEVAAWHHEEKGTKQSLAAFCRQVGFAGGWALFGNAIETRRLAGVPLSDRRRMLAVTHDLLFSNDDDKVVAFFSSLIRAPSSTGTLLLRKIFPKFYSQLYDTFGVADTEALWPIKERFEDFLVRHSKLDLGLLDYRHTILQRLPEEEVHVGLQTAAERLRISPNLVKMLIAIRRIKTTTVTCGRRKELRIRGADVRMIEEAVSDRNGVDPLAPLGSRIGTSGKGFLSTEDIRRRLAISSPTVHRLCKAKVIPLARGPNVDGFRRWIVDPDEYAAFETRLRSCVRKKGKKSALVGLGGRAVRGLRAFDFGLPELLTTILAGEIPLAAIDESESGIRKLYVYADDIDALRTRLKEKQQESHLTAAEVAKRLFVQPAVVSVLCKRGILPSCDMLRGGPLFDAVTIRAFQRSYISLGEIQSQAGRKVHLAELERINITPAFRAGPAYGCRCFFDRKRVEPVLTAIASGTNTIRATATGVLPVQAHVEQARPLDYKCDSRVIKSSITATRE